MRGQCGIAVVAATLATGKGSTPARDAVVAPPHVLFRRKPRGSPPPSVLEAAIAGGRKDGSPPTGTRDGEPLLRMLPSGWSARQEASCADATPCPQLLRRTKARRVRRRGLIGPTAAHDAAEGDGVRTACSRRASSITAGVKAAAAGDMHNEVLLVRGGGTSWFGRSDYDEFPPDFEYDPTDDHDDGDDNGAEDSSAAFCWPEDDEDPAASAPAVAAPPPQQERDAISSKKADLKDFLEEEEDALMKEDDQGSSRRSSRPDRKTLSSVGFGQGAGEGEGEPAASPARAVKRLVLVFVHRSFTLRCVCACGLKLRCQINMRGGRLRLRDTHVYAPPPRVCGRDFCERARCDKEVVVLTVFVSRSLSLSRSFSRRSKAG